jgi:MFS family permease
MEGTAPKPVWDSVTSTLETARPSVPAYANIESPPARPGSFGPLRVRNFRLFLTGQLFSFTGTWVQRIAQDWLVLTLTGSATAVGITTALQFLPTMLFGLFGGLLADRVDKRRLLYATVSAQCAMATILAVLTLTHQVQVWHVWVVAFALGAVVSVDNPTRQSFVNEMVGPDQLRSAIGLNSAVFQSGALIGPAISGVLITAFGSGLAFVINAVSFAAPFSALLLMRPSELRQPVPTPRGRGQMRDALRFARSHSEIMWPIILAGTFGFFTTNLPVSLASFAHSVFHSGASGYGLLTSALAIGSLIGALLSTRRRSVRLRTLCGTGAVASTVLMVVALVPGQWTFTAALLPLGVVMLLFVTGANSCVQIAAPDSLRGRVMGIYLLVFIGCGAFGGPLIGWIDESFGPRTGLFLSGLVPGLVLVAVTTHLAHIGELRLARRPWADRPRLVAVVPR